MGRIINETAVTSLVAADVFLVDNPTLGTRKIAESDLAVQFEIVARKGVASGYASLDANGLVPAAQLQPSFTIEAAADATARDALTILAGEVGKRLVRLTDTGVIYLANATGSGSSKWTVFNSMAQASTAALGIVQLATDAVARTGTDTAKVPTASSMRAGVAILRNALAAAQGLVGDGTAAAGVATLGSALGTYDWTIPFEIDVPTSNPSATQGICSINTAGGTYAEARALDIILDTAGVLQVNLFGATGADYRAASLTANLVSNYGGKRVKLVITQSAGTLVIYVDGLSSAFTTATGGTPPAWNGGVNNTSFVLGGAGTTYKWTGYIRTTGPRNRALSAAEVLALFETGTSASADYNNASNTTMVGGVFSNFQYDTFSGASATGFTAVETSGLGTQAGSSSTGTFMGVRRVGTRIRVKFTATLTSGAVPSVFLQSSGVGDASDHVGIVAGANDIVFTLTAPFTAESGAGSGQVIFTASGNTSYAISGLLVTPVGLLCAPAANAPGNGYQLKDMSGNKADITLPATGVAWALPDRRPNSVRGTLTWSATHEGKSLLGQRALPDGAVVTLITSKATAGSSGSGKTIGTTNSATRWAAAAVFTTAKKVDTLSNQLPAGTADADNDIVVDPDTANITASIEVEAHYVITQSGV